MKNLPAGILILTLSGASPMAQQNTRDLLNGLTGDWTVDVTYVIAGHEQRGSATMHADWILDHHFVRQEYSAPMNGRTFLTLQFLGYDSVRQKFTILKMDSLDDAMLYADGNLSTDGRTLTFIGERSDMVTRSTGRLRQVLTVVDTDHFDLEWFLTDKDAAEAKTVTMKHKRQMMQK